MVTITQMKFGKLVLLAAITVAVSAVAAASPLSMTAFPEDSSTRIDSFTSYEVEIENTGPAMDTYTLTSSSVEEIDVAPRKVTLEPGESEKIQVWYNPSPDREEGTYSFSITAESRATGQRYSEKITASVIRDHDVNIELAESKTVCRGKTAEYTVQVTNNGLQKEEFQVTTGYGHLSQNRVTLEDGETKTLTLTASSKKEVSKQFNVKAASTTSYAQDIQNVRFKAEACYESDLSVTPTKMKVPGSTTQVIDVTIRNTGTKEDTFTLSTNTGKFAENPVTVDGESTKTVELKVTPVELGKKTVEITANGESSATAQVQLSVYNGNDVEVSYENQKPTFCETEKPAIHATVKNTGKAQEIYDIKVSKGLLDQSSARLDVEESETVRIGLDQEPFREGNTYKVKTTAKALTYQGPKDSATAQVRIANCYDLSMNVVPEVASAGENRSVIYEIQLENTGTKQNTYHLTHQGPAWISIKPDTVTVPAGQTKKAYMYSGIPFKKEGNVQITATAEGTNVSKSQTVELVIGQKIEQAIKDGANNAGTPTGAFTDLQAGALGKILLGVIVAAAVIAAILIREW